ncbi:DUF1428 domain-containing protein [Microbulbifer sp. ZKSA006]|uniref:DUF1428 domain-containing protein n=2 Tax=unclassified Microbulbifer TaxID=2619833 RepID=UPI0040394F80
MSYVDGVVTAVPTANIDDYIRHAKIAAEVFKEQGALRVVEAWGDDIPQGEITSFPIAVKCAEDETVVFSWIIWPSKKVRNSAWRAIVDDPRMHPEHNPMPFDGKRMIYGGFSVILDE